MQVVIVGLLVYSNYLLLTILIGEDGDYYWCCQWCRWHYYRLQSLSTWSVANGSTIHIFIFCLGIDKIPSSVFVFKSIVLFWILLEFRVGPISRLVHMNAIKYASKAYIINSWMYLRCWGKSNRRKTNSYSPYFLYLSPPPAPLPRITVIVHDQLVPGPKMI